MTNFKPPIVIMVENSHVDMQGLTHNDFGSAPHTCWRTYNSCHAGRTKYCDLEKNKMHWLFFYKTQLLWASQLYIMSASHLRHIISLNKYLSVRWFEMSQNRLWKWVILCSRPPIKNTKLNKGSWYYVNYQKKSAVILC